MNLTQLIDRIDRLVVIIHRSHSRKAALFCRVEWERQANDKFWDVVRESFAEVAALHPDRAEFMFCKFWVLLDVVLNSSKDHATQLILARNDSVFTDKFGQPELVAFVLPKLRALLD